VYVNIVPYFSSSNTVFWNAFPNDYLYSTDCSYIFSFDSPHHGINNFQVRSSYFPGLRCEHFLTYNRKQNFTANFLVSFFKGGTIF
jgi:hypothetical protein